MSANTELSTRPAVRLGGAGERTGTDTGPGVIEIGMLEAIRYLRILMRNPLEAATSFPAPPDLVRIHAPGNKIHVVRAAEHARHVLVTNQDAYAKGTDYEVLGLLLGEGLLTNRDADSWQRQRRLVQPMFAKRHLDPFAEQMTAAAADTLERWQRQVSEGGVLDVAAAMNALTLDVVGRALFGAELIGESDKIGRAMTDVLRAGVAMLRSGLPAIADAIPGLSLGVALRLRAIQWRRAMRAIEELDSVVEPLVRERRGQVNAAQDNLLALLLSARDPDSGEGMSDRQVRDEVMTFLAAGHETTANALAWTWLLLSRHPGARERLYEEVDEVLGGARPSAADAERLPWANAVLQESMRIYPPVPAVTRVARTDDRVAGIRIRRGGLVAVVTYMLHRDPRWWPNPEGFDPERFMPGAPERPKLAFMPFGAGRRVCVGAGFAQLEGVLLLAMIAQRFRLDLAPGANVELEPAITLRPRDGLPMTLHRRG